MTLRDLLDNVVVEGMVEATIFDDQDNEVKSYASFANGGTSVDFPEDYLEKEVTHIYSVVGYIGNAITKIDLRG